MAQFFARLASVKSVVLATVVLIAGSGAGAGIYLGSVEAAHVQITLQSQRIQISVVVHGATAGGQFETQQLHVSLTESATRPASGRGTSGGTYATGFVEVGCDPPLPCTSPAAKAGSLLCRVGIVPAVCFVTQAAVTCYCGEAIPVRAGWTGAGYNTPAHTTFAAGWNTGSAIVLLVNSAAITGGTDPVTYPVVQQSDLDSAATRLRTQLASDLQSALTGKAGDLRYFPDVAPNIVVSSDVAAGAHRASMEVIAIGTLDAMAFRDLDAEKLIAQSLNAKVPAGFRLAGPPEVTDYQVQKSKPQGTVTVSGTAIGYVVAQISVDSLRSSLRGRDLAAARRLIAGVAPGSRIVIQLAPFSTPWLPASSSNISILVEA